MGGLLCAGRALGSGLGHRPRDQALEPPLSRGRDLRTQAEWVPGVSRRRSALDPARRQSQDSAPSLDRSPRRDARLLGGFRDRTRWTTRQARAPKQSGFARRIRGAARFRGPVAFDSSALVLSRQLHSAAGLLRPRLLRLGAPLCDVRRHLRTPSAQPGAVRHRASHHISAHVLPRGARHHLTLPSGRHQVAPAGVRRPVAPHGGARVSSRRQSAPHPLEGQRA